MNIYGNRYLISLNIKSSISILFRPSHPGPHAQNALSSPSYSRQHSFAILICSSADFFFIVLFLSFCAGALRDRTPVTGYNTPTAHFRNRRCLARCRRRLGRAFALKPAEEASSSHSKSAAAVPDVNAPSRTVRPPFRLFDPFSAGLDQFQPTAFMAPVRTSVATGFNPGEHIHDTTKQS